MELEPLKQTTTQLTRQSFDATGQLRSEADQVYMVVEAWKHAQAWLGTESSYKLEWSTCDIVYRSPRAYSFWEGAYVLEPNLRRFDVAKWVNSVVSQVMQALFSQDPPLAIQPGPKMSTESAQAWEVLLGRLMKESGSAAVVSDRMPGMAHGFKEEFNLLTEQWALKGTGVGKYFVVEEEICIERRKSSVIQMPAGAAGKGAVARKKGPPEIEKTYAMRKRLKFEFIDLGAEDCIAWETQAAGGDIRLAKWVINRYLVDFYDLQKLAMDPRYNIPGAKVPKERLDEDDQLKRDETDDEMFIAGTMIDLWMPPAATDNREPAPVASQMQQNLSGWIHMAQRPGSVGEANPLRKKLELLEYLDQQTGKVITVIQRERRIREGDAEFGYLSGNYWNLPNAIVGIGIGQIGSNNQQLSQWIVNSALKVLALSLNAPHIAPDTVGQSPRVLRIGAQKVLTVTEQAFNAGGMKLMEMAKVDPSIWPVLQESTKEGESATGADSLMVQGSSQGPRAGMGRTSGGANIMASKAETRLDGPMDHLVTQIFLPYIGALIWFVFHHMGDDEILDILGEELGDKFLNGDPSTDKKAFNLEEFSTAKFDYDVLLGAKLGSLRNLAQSLVLMFEYGMNPEMQQFLADVHGTTIDVQTIYKLLLLSSHCGTGVANEIIRPLTKNEQARHQQQQQMQAQMGPGGKLAAIKAQGEVNSQLQDQKTEGRMMEKLTDRIDLAAAMPEAEGGQPGGTGFGANE